jgi:adenylate kinase
MSAKTTGLSFFSGSPILKFHMNKALKNGGVKEWLGTGSINFFGLPFAGKDSQAHRLQAVTGGQVLGGGDILRNSVIPKHVQDIMNDGELIPTEEYVRIVLPYLKSEAFTNKPLLLSSVGRWLGEEQSVIDALNEASHPLKAVIHLSLDENTVRNRFLLEEKITKRGTRADDDAAVLEKRIVEFKEKTMPVIEFYRQHNLLIEVDATLPKNAVTEEILHHLEQKALRS